MKANHYAPRLSLLDHEGCERLHNASLEILRKTGVRVHHAEALRLLRDAGALCEEGNLVKLPAGLVERALGKAPSRVVLCRRGTKDVAVDLVGRKVSFGPGSDGLYYHDPRTGRRRFNAADVAASVRLCDALDSIGFVMSMGIPEDVATDVQYRRQFALMVANTVKPIVFVAEERTDCEAIVAMAAASAGGLDKLRQHPTLLLYSEPTSPLQHGEASTSKLLFMAEQGLPIVHSPAPMMGGTAPVTLAGGAALGNAEVLSSLVIHQLQNEHAPFVYGTGLHHLDMRATISVYGAPEFQLARAIMADMARFYGLPLWGYAGCSDSPVMDAQAAADAAYQVRDAFLTGTNLVHDVGYLEGGLATSPELIVFTAEMIDMHRHFEEGFEIGDETLALDVIHDAGPGGDFLATDHTRRHFRKLYVPKLFERRRHDEWRKASGAQLGDRLREKTVALLDEHAPEPLPGEVEDEIERIVEERR